MLVSLRALDLRDDLCEVFALLFLYSYRSPVILKDKTLFSVALGFARGVARLL
jgi:hypothetical protein